MELKTFKDQFRKTKEGQNYELLIRQRYDQLTAFNRANQVIAVKRNKLHQLGIKV